MDPKFSVPDALPPVPPVTEDFARVCCVDPTVARMMRHGNSLEEIIVQLARDKWTLMRRLQTLANIAPRKIRMPDGRVVVWHCPDDLVPETECGPFSPVEP